MSDTQIIQPVQFEIIILRIFSSSVYTTKRDKNISMHKTKFTHSILQHTPYITLYFQ